MGVLRVAAAAACTAALSACGYAWPDAIRARPLIEFYGSDIERDSTEKQAAARRESAPVDVYDLIAGTRIAGADVRVRRESALRHFANRSPEDQRQLRNQSQNELILRSKTMCDSYLADIEFTDFVAQNSLGIIPPILSGLGALFTNVDVVRSLSATSAGVGGTVARLNDKLVQAEISRTIRQGVENRRSEVFDQMVTRQPTPIDSYPIEIAIVDVQRYHEACNMVTGLVEARMATRGVQDPEFEQAMKIYRRVRDSIEVSSASGQTARQTATGAFAAAATAAVSAGTQPAASALEKEILDRTGAAAISVVTRAESARAAWRRISESAGATIKSSDNCATVLVNDPSAKEDCERYFRLVTNGTSIADLFVSAAAAAPPSILMETCGQLVDLVRTVASVNAATVAAPFLARTDESLGSDAGRRIADDARAAGTAVRYAIRGWVRELSELPLADIQAFGLVAVADAAQFASGDYLAENAKLTNALASIQFRLQTVRQLFKQRADRYRDSYASTVAVGAAEPREATKTVIGAISGKLPNPAGLGGLKACQERVPGDLRARLTPPLPA